MLLLGRPAFCLVSLPNYTLFPRRLVVETAEILRASGATFGRYGDFSSWAHCRTRIDYLREFAFWQAGVRSRLGLVVWAMGRFLRRRVARALRRPMPYRNGSPLVFFQHDADRLPELTLMLMDLEQLHRVISSCYFFKERSPSFPGDDEPYVLDVARMQRFESLGFEIGYHQNAFERADYDVVRALAIARDDVAFFRAHFNLRSFVPHGGIRGRNGENNNCLPHADCFSGLLWAYNTRGLATDFVWSDGHVEFPGPCNLEDPRSVASRVRGKARAQFLFHPEYYGDILRPDWRKFSISRSMWWRQLWKLQ